jgi:hypothetical protein
MPTQRSFFHRAVAALRDGNPYPMLSDQATFDSEAVKAHWRRKADLMEEVVTSIHNRIVSIKLADNIWRLLIEDHDINNPALARTLLGKLLAAAEADGEADQAYAEFLAEIAPTEDIPQILSALREHRQKVATHVRTLLGRIATNA